MQSKFRFVPPPFTHCPTMSCWETAVVFIQNSAVKSPLQKFQSAESASVRREFVALKTIASENFPLQVAIFASP